MNAKYIASMKMATGGRASDYLSVNAQIAAEMLGFLHSGDNPANGLTASANLRRAADLLRTAASDIDLVIRQLDAPAL